MHWTTGLLSFSLVIAVAVSNATQHETINADYIFENVNVIPLTEEVVLTHQAVAIRGGQIVAILDQSSASSIAAPVRIDAAGQYLLPGLTDMHVHMRMNPQTAFNLFLANGVTTVFNMGLGDRNGDTEIDHLQLREAVADGLMDGPRYLVSGPQIHAAEVPTLAEVQSMLELHVEKGYDTIKVHGPLDDNVYDSLVRGARERGLRITGHAQHLRPLSHSLQLDAIEHMEEFVYVSRDPAHGKLAAGSLENYLEAYFPHAEKMSDPEFRAPVVREVAESGIYIDPTLIIYKYILTYVSDGLFAELQSDERLAYLDRRIRDEYLDPHRNEYRAGFAKMLRENLGSQDAAVAHIARNVATLSALLIEMQKAGVPLLLGTDSFGAVVPGFSIHQELELMVDAGLTPYEALLTGTVNVADYLGEANSAGTVEIGKRADFFLVQDNPLSDVRNAANVSGVFSHCKWRSASDLEEMLLESRTFHSDH